MEIISYLPAKGIEKIHFWGWLGGWKWKCTADIYLSAYSSQFLAAEQIYAPFLQTEKLELHFTITSQKIHLLSHWVSNEDVGTWRGCLHYVGCRDLNLSQIQ